MNPLNDFVNNPLETPFSRSTELKKFLITSGQRLIFIIDYMQKINKQPKKQTNK